MKSLSFINKTLVSAGFFSLLCFSGLNQAAVSQQPLMLVESVAPNLIFTLDSSGSMRWGFAPDSIGINNGNSSQNAIRNSRRAKSATFNPLYYNPDVTYDPPIKLNNDGTFDGHYSTSFNSAYHNGYQTGYGTVDLSTNYKVTWNWDINSSQNYNYNSSANYAAPTGQVYNLAENPDSEFRTTGRGGSDRRRLGVHAYYYVYDESISGCNNNSNNDNCYRKVDVVGADEQKNFANWYSFYRTRSLATLTAANLAFNNLPASIRFTWQDLDRCALNDSNCRNNYFRAFTERHKSNFFRWLSEVKFDTGTPLRKALDDAGKFLMTNDAWAYNPNPMQSNGSLGSTVRQPEYACRPSFHVMMSDGMWNGANGNPSGTFRHDNTAFSLPGISNYARQRPYADGTSNTLADLAMHYWATDLRPNLDNDLKPYLPFKGPNENWDPRNNPATWQHMVNYTMGLGLSQSLRQTGLQWEGDTFSGGYENLLNGSRNWPAAGADSGNNVYDLWHAAINSRGEFFSVDRPEDMIKAFNDIINRIAERTATAAAAGAAPSTIDNDPTEASNFTLTTKAYFPEYNSEEWSGDLKQVIISRDQAGRITRTPGWSAQAMIDAQASRNIYMGGGGAGGTGLRSFSYSNLSNDLRTIFNRNPDTLGNTTDNRGSQRVAYLSGARGNEGDADNQFRRRSSALGDIVNSQPAVVGTPTYLPYLADRIDGSRGEYLAFQKKYTTSGPNPGRPELIYVGANDGMLHAISAADGSEVFAFIPQTLLQHMPKLTGQNYKGGGHRFYVDGSPIVRDVYINNQWRTVLVGTLRAGGKSLFALDVTEPGADGSGVKLLWEITNDTDDFENLGYSFPEPEITRLHSGEWAVLQGNGYDSADGVASLFIIDIADGSLIKEIIAEEGEDGPNGLSSIRGADNNADGIVDYAYAGDLQGNLWRFDLSKTSSRTIVGDPFGPTNQSAVTAADYKVSYGGQPLYKARYSGGQVQPITSPPSLVRHPSRLGYLVLFGTGKYFEIDDAAPDTTKAHTMYAIWDRLTKAQSGSHPADLTRSNLQPQSIEQQKVTTFTNDGSSITRELRYISENDVTWYRDGVTPTQEANNSNVQTWGWFVDLEVNSKQGEMMIQRMSAQGDTLLFNTLTPNADPCADGATYWAYAVNPYTGGRTRHPTFDFNQDGKFDLQDTDGGTVPSAYSTASPGSPAGDSVIAVDSVTPFSRAARTSGRLTWQSMPLEVEE